MNRRTSKRMSDAPLSPSSSAVTGASSFRKSKTESGTVKKKSKMAGTSSKLKEAPSVSTLSNFSETTSVPMDYEEAMTFSVTQEMENNETRLLQEQQKLLEAQINNTLDLPSVHNINVVSNLQLPATGYIPNYNQENRVIELGALNQKIIYILPPSLNQIHSTCDNIRQIQQTIDKLKSYLNRLQSNVDQNLSFSLKNYMMFEEPQENRIDYQEIMLALLREKDVNSKNFYKFSKLLHSYYIQCFDSIVPIAHVIVNVNYTRNKTKITHSITHFINLCVNYVVSSVRVLLSSSGTALSPVSQSIRAEYLEHIQETQKYITNYYTYKLVELTNTVFYKHTPDNDDNRFESHQAVLPSDHIYDIPIYVLMVSNKLNF